MKKFLFTTCMLGALVATGKNNPIRGISPATPVQAKIASCNPATAIIDLDINNVRASVLTGGDMWWNLNDAKYEVPAGSNKHSMFAGSLWIGGIDGGGQIKVAAQTYRQTGNDYWPGAMDTTTTDIIASRCTFYNRFWKVERQLVIDFVNNGTTTPDIISWPGNGDATYNEGNYLAPFYDNNGDGIYNTLDGDYPGYNLSSTFPTVPNTPVELCDDYLFGDQSIWWVINDVGNVHTETNSIPIGLEIRCQAFAFQSALPSLDNATFYKYQVINRSTLSYTNMYFGQWVDPDLGNAVDDYVGCDVGRGLGYCYNGDADDDGAAGYGIDPPAIGVDFLQGPGADELDAIDNDLDGCIDCTFYDSAGTILVIPDAILHEPIQMSKFVKYDNVNNSPTGNPNGFTDVYNYLQGIWLDNQPITYGADGRNPNNPICNFMFPGTTDPNFPTDWTELTAGNIPEDRRFIQSAGSFTMLPGEVNYVTTGVIWARQTGGGPLGSLALLQQYDTDVQQLFSQCFRTTGVGLTESPGDVLVDVYPNPSSQFVQFEFTGQGTNHKIEVFSASGIRVLNIENVQTAGYRMDVSKLASGTYYYRVTDRNQGMHTGKLSVVRQ